MKTTGDNTKREKQGKRSFQETMDYLSSKLSRYDKKHENFIVPWQMERKEKEYDFK